jgi:hypothetical protein
MPSLDLVYSLAIMSNAELDAWLDEHEDDEPP